MLAAVLVLLLSTGQIVYRLTLPTDGWNVVPEGIEGANWMYFQNLVGAASDLQVGDEVLAVDGRSVSGSASNAYIPAPDNWQIGRTVTMLILREGVEMEVAVPVVAWTLAHEIFFYFMTAVLEDDLFDGTYFVVCI